MVLADDHAVVRSGLRLLLVASRWRVVGEVNSAQEAVAAVQRERPDALVLDLSMPGGSGLGVIETVKEASPSTAVVVLTMHEDPAYARAALRAGARAFLLKEAAAEELLTALSHAVRGASYVQPTVGARLAAADAATGTLTAREREVLSLLAQGNTNDEISARLHFSVRTVEAHRARLRDKLGLRTRAELASYAREHGL